MPTTVVRRGVSCEEAFSLWHVANSNYARRERLSLWSNYAHDPDLKYIIDKYLHATELRLKDIESELQKAGIGSPDPGVTAIRTETNAEVVRDRHIAGDLMLIMQLAIELNLRCIKTTIVSDPLRAYFMHQASVAIDDMDGIVFYLRLRGWIGTIPLYRNSPPEEKESLDAGEAYHLWDHLAYRYDNIQLTRTLAVFASDADLQALVTLGRKQLEKESNQLEKECLRFGVPLPPSPPAVVGSPPSKELLTDRFIYRAILTGITSAETFHAQALTQCTTNDRVRGIFRTLLESEVASFDRMAKYGKLKGWLNQPPEHRLLS